MKDVLCIQETKVQDKDFPREAFGEISCHCVFRGQKAYTFWDYRIPHAFRRGLGWRVDHIWATACLAEKSKRAWIDLAPMHLPRPSDHTFIVGEFEIQDAN